MAVYASSSCLYLLVMRSTSRRPSSGLRPLRQRRCRYVPGGSGSVVRELGVVWAGWGRPFPWKTGTLKFSAGAHPVYCKAGSLQIFGRNEKESNFLSTFLAFPYTQGTHKYIFFGKEKLVEQGVKSVLCLCNKTVRIMLSIFGSLG